MADENAIEVAPKGPTGLATVNVAAMQKAKYDAEDGDAKKLFGQRVGFLPRLQLFTSNSEPVKRGTMPVATFAVVKGKDAPIQIGKETPFIPIAWRAKAMQVKTDPPMAFHDQKSKEFLDIKAKADADSNSGNMYGPEYLLWIPVHGFVTFFMGSKTARNEAPAVRALLPTPDGRFRTGILGSTFIETKEYSWHGPKVSLSSQSIEQPPADDLELVVADFLNPKDSEIKEEAPAEAVKDDR